MNLIGYGILALFISLIIYRIYSLEKELIQQQSEISLLKQRIVDIDPQFDDERAFMKGFNEAMAKGGATLLGTSHADLIKKKELTGKPTLFEPFKN